jgi:hypothetical protein
MMSSEEEQRRRWNEDQHILTLINRKWEQELSGYITKAINKAVDQLFNATAEAISFERGDVDKKLETLRKELLGELTLRMDAIKFDRAARGEVIDLPKMRLRGSA